MKLRAALFNFLMALWTFIVATFFLPILFFAHPTTLTRVVGAPWAHGVLWLARRLCGIRYKLEGLDYLQRGPVIYASKHQSALEIIVLMAHVRYPAFVLKRELLFIPMYGQYLWRMGMIPIKRSAREKALKAMMNAARTCIYMLRPLIIFPEGTRTAPGVRGRYLPGAAALYHELKIPVIPIAVNTGLYWPRTKLDKTPGTAIIRFLPPIQPGLAPKAFLRQLQEVIESESETLYQQGLKTLQKEKTDASLRPSQ